MKAASPALIALLASGQFRAVELVTITLVGGTVYRYSLGDADYVVGGHSFTRGPVWERGEIRSVIGTEVGDLKIEASVGPDDQIGGMGWIAAARSGVFDGAWLRLDRLYLSDWADTSPGTLWVFEGRVADLETGRARVAMTVKSPMALLNVPTPRDVSQAACLNALFDAGCTLDRDDWSVAATVGAGSTPTRIVCDLAAAADHYTLGKIAFTGGPLAGYSRTVKHHSPGVVVPIFPLPAAPQAGDTFTAWPGCNLRMGTCADKFDNLANFRGQPFVPIPESVI